MNIAIIGTGYVGLTTGALFADRGNRVVCVDINPKVLETLRAGDVHFYEPGLKEIVKRTVERGNLQFSDNTTLAVKYADAIFLCVDTPSDGDGKFDLKYIRTVARDVGQALKGAHGFKVVVSKSTVPQGTYKVVQDIINENIGYNKDLEWAYVANPETLAEGSAVRDFEKPHRIIIGTDSDKAFKIMQELYHPFVLKGGNRILRGSPVDAELAKLYSNTALALRISMINEMSRIADLYEGADMDTIRRMVCSDQRIGHQFMFPSPGYGGSCFPKDVQGLVHQANNEGFEPMLLSRVHHSNETHKNYIGKRVIDVLQKENPTIGVWGVTFKPGTDDMRQAASVPIINHLLEKGCKVQIYDPKDEKAREIFGDKVSFCSNEYEAATGADALMLLTEWRHFDSPDYHKLREVMNGTHLFDFRNRWLPQAANRAGFHYAGVGRLHPL